MASSRLVAAVARRLDVGQTSQALSVLEELLAFERQWNAAVRGRDRAWMEQHLADDYTYVNSRGRLFTKAEDIAEALDPSNKTELVLEDAKVRMGTLLC